MAVQKSRKSRSRRDMRRSHHHMSVAELSVDATTGEKHRRHHMKIIILAAGIGSRLGNPFPKPLTPLKDGKSIMQRQINNITTYFDVNDITTVVGFKKNLIMEQFPEVNYVYNPFFDRTNTSKSLLRALKKHRGNSILWFNGDVVFDHQLLSLLLEDIYTKQFII